MSMTAVMEFASSLAAGDSEASPLGWLLETLQQAIEGVMANETTKPLQKANAVARLGNLYLKTYRAAELQRENKALARRIAELEACLAEAQAGSEAPVAAPATASRSAAAGGTRRVAAAAPRGIRTGAGGPAPAGMGDQIRQVVPTGVGVSAATLESD